MELSLLHVSKIYPNGTRALDDVSLTIPPGLFGLLGPNGAGKSTLMRIVATLQEPDSGAVTFGDIDVRRRPEAMRRVLGYLPQEFGFYPNLSAEATLDHFATLKGLTHPRERKETVHWLLRQTNLWETRFKHVGGFSGGMRQRLGVAVALLGRPRILIVDEPTAGLDPTERHRFLNLLAEVGEDIVVILSTHIVEDVQELCSQMAILSHGRIVTIGRPADVVEELRGRLWRGVLENEELPEAMARYRVLSTRRVAGKPVVSIYSAGPPGDRFARVEPDLGDAYFFHVTGGAPPVAPEPPAISPYLPPDELELPPVMDGYPSSPVVDPPAPVDAPPVPSDASPAPGVTPAPDAVPPGAPHPPPKTGGLSDFDL